LLFQTDVVDQLARRQPSQRLDSGLALRAPRNDEAHRTRFPERATKDSASGKGDFMKIWISAAAAMVMVGQAYAADVAICTLGADKKTVTVTATNPYSQVMACEVNCDMALAGGISTVVCVKPVPVGSKDFVMCTQKAAEGVTYTRVKETTVNCPDPAAQAKSTKAETQKADDDDDARADEMMQKMMKQGQEMLDRMKKK